MRLTHPLAGRKARKTKQEPQAVRLTQPPRESREEPDQEARPRRKQNGGLPLVIDKTKGIQVRVYLVYIDYRSVAVPRTDQRTDHLTKL